MTEKQILQKKGAFKAEMDRMMPREQSDALWQKGEERLDRILQRYSSLPKGIVMMRTEPALKEDCIRKARAEQHVRIPVWIDPVACFRFRQAKRRHVVLP